MFKKRAAGKTAVVDALRFTLGTTGQEWYRLEDTDFHEGGTSREIRIICKFNGLSAQDKRAFVEYLTYGENSGEKPVFYVNWTVKDTGETRRGRPYRRPEVHSGKDGNGPTIAQEVRELLRATYLRPLRDAEQVLSAGRGSRLAQILRHSDLIKEGEDACDTSKPLEDQDLNVLAIGKLIDDLLETQQGILRTRSEIDNHLNGLSLSGDGLTSSIKVSGSTASDDIRLRQMLQKLDLILAGAGELGLGSNNLLFMACELLLLAQEAEGNKLLLIEEPEAHLHAQRQLQVTKSMQKKAKKKSIQIIVTTHSPNLASAIELDNMVMIHNGRAYSMAKGKTQLEPSDYRFLQRFLDVTKANLFFARGVMIVEGDAEHILLPTLASLLDRDFTEHGVSIVNVGGVGLRRYSRIFQRTDVAKEGQLDIPVACVTDMDVMPNCAPVIIGKLKEGDAWPGVGSKRRWRAKKDIGNKDALVEYREKKAGKDSGQCVKTFVSDEWTLEYDLAFYGLAEDVCVAAYLAKKEGALDEKTLETETNTAQEAYKQLEKEAREAGNVDGCLYKEVLATKVYALFTTGTKASKAIAAQYLGERLQKKHDKHELTSGDLRSILPNYLTEAIDYVTDSPDTCDPGPNREGTANE